MSFPAWIPTLFGLIAALAQQADPDRYVIDAAASRFTATVGTTGILSTFGHDHTIALREFSGELHLSEEDVESGSLRMSIPVASLGEIAKDFSDADRKKIDKDIQEKALEVAQYPEIVFHSTGLSSRQIADGEYQIDVRGQLTLHGVTRQLSIATRVTLQEGTLTARGEFTVLHRDYKILRLSAAAGTVKASDEIRMSFEIVARKP
jgi:polyisoprenoid-binding protein YceI